jgi:Asp-tRNA(Asn)/Glu-tRNA(Gln) amidotransferase A subunit family amidase
MMPANPSQDTMGPMTRCVADAARVLDVVAGYDPNDPVTAEMVGHIPASYLTALKPDALKGVRVGVEVVDSLVIPALADRRIGNDFETEQATKHRRPPATTPALRLSP